MKDNDLWRTPKHISKVIEYRIGEKFDLDVACTSEDAICSNGLFFDLGLDGLSEKWIAESAWCNPPYSEKMKWIVKAIEETKRSCKSATLLIPCDTSTQSFRICFENASRIFLFDKRIAFIDPKTGKPGAQNRNASMAAVFGDLGCKEYQQKIEMIHLRSCSERMA